MKKNRHTAIAVTEKKQRSCGFEVRSFSHEKESPYRDCGIREMKRSGIELVPRLRRYRGIELEYKR